MANCDQSVYISCVEEIRHSFVSHLLGALHRKGINVLDVDSADLLSREAQTMVEKARVSVIILPGNRKPTTASACLGKLRKIFKYQTKEDQVVIPVLYGVRGVENEWLGELKKMTGLSPFHQSSKECSDSKLVNEIVKNVYEKLYYMGQIGIFSKLVEIEKMVCKQPLVIRRVGIWGMAGIGKTTLAKAVFDQISGDFDACCFIEDYDKSIHEKGLYRLLEEQFFKEISDADHGTIMTLSFLRNKLNNKRVLIVLDDVHNPLVAEPFLEEIDWFGSNSLIIITSRDKQVLRLCGVDLIYEVQGLNEKESLQLFLLHASIKDMAEQNLHELTMKVIKHANGHPLALNIYGRELKRKRKLSEMETAFLKLKRRPPFEIVDVFKSRYGTLSDSEKNIFLDIACFFNGENVDYVTQLLEGCGFFPHVGIDVLVGKSLVTVSENRVWMHNLVQDVGREIINGATVQIKRRSRLWEPLIIKYLLEDDERKGNVEAKTTIKRAQGTEEIQGIFLDTSNLSFDVKPAAFENMLNLRLLKIYCSNPETHSVISFSKGFLHSLPNQLRLLHWENYPLQSLPQNFDPKNLVEINMTYSQLQKLWGGTKNLEMLRTIKLCHSQQLDDIEIVSKAQNLEFIDLQGCTRLQSFAAIGQLLHLRVVNLSGCTSIKIFPELPPNIETLHLQGTGIIELPHSIVKPNGGELVSLIERSEGLSDALKIECIKSLMKMSSASKDLGKLICLDLKDCCRLQSLPNMVNLESLKVLDLSGCLELKTIQGFPRNLKELNIAGTAVGELPELPQSLELLYAHGCVNLESFSLDSEKLPMHNTFSNCINLSPQVVNKFLVKALAYVKHMPREHQHELNKAPAFSFCVPSHADHNSILGLQPEASVMIRLNPSWRNMLVGFTMLVVVKFSEDYSDFTGSGISCVCRWKDKEGHSHRIERNFHCWSPGKVVPKVQKDHMFVFCDVNMHPSTSQVNDPDIWADLVVFEFFPVDRQKKRRLDDICTVKRCGVYAIDAETCNTRLKISSPVEASSEKVEEVLRVTYDGLLEMNKVLFLYIACLFNDEDADFVAPLIAITDLDVTSGLKVLAGRSLIHISSNGEIGMHCLLRRMGKEILHTEPMLPGSSKDLTTDFGKVDSMAFYSSPNSEFNVFLSFHRQDIKANFFIDFVDVLQNTVIPTIRDREIKISQVRPTPHSNISIILFSINYASSIWLLNNLVEKASNEDLSNIVIPIFHPNVDPMDVKEQTGEFGRQFEKTCKNKTEDEKQKWRRALTDIASILGNNYTNCSEEEFLNAMVEEAKRLLASIHIEEKLSREEINQGMLFVPARSLDITHSKNPKLWTWSSIYDEQSEAIIEIATLIKIYWLQIKGHFHTRKLTPGTKYEVVFTVYLDDTASGWQEPVTLKLKLKYRDGSQSLQESTLCLNGYMRDNWVDIPAGEFEAPSENGAEIFFSLHQYMDIYQKSGLMVKGVAIRRKDQVIT